MILDKQNLFSEDQAVTVTAVSTNVIDLGADDAYIQNKNEKGMVELWVQVTEAFVGGTSVQVKLEEDDDVAFGASEVLVETPAVVTASLVAGYQFAIQMPARLKDRYARLTYTVVGTYTQGKISAGLILDRQTNGVA